MPAWSLVAAGHATSTDTIRALTEHLTAILTQPGAGTKLSELRADGDKPVRVTLHGG